MVRTAEQLSFESSGMKRIVPEFSGPDHRVEDGQELAHAIDDSDLLGLAGADVKYALRLYSISRDETVRESGGRHHPIRPEFEVSPGPSR